MERSKDCGELIRTYDYCDGCEYSSWEQYYENLLAGVTSEHFGFTYNKRKLNPRFKNRKCAEQYVNLLCQSFVRRREQEKALMRWKGIFIIDEAAQIKH